LFEQSNFPDEKEMFLIEILQYYTSGFWTWAGITIGFSAITWAFGRGVNFMRFTIQGR